MVEGGRNRSTALQRLAKWPTTSPSSSMNNWSDSKKYGVSVENSYFQPIDHENLVQGSLYIMKVKIVTIALFEGWNDDMCCFSVLRSDTESMRWSDARYLPGDFEAFDAFDDAGNPPVYFWTRFLRVQVPVNWFSLFEEARLRQRMWNMDIQHHYIYQQQQQRQQQMGINDEDDDMISFPAPNSSITSLPLNNNGIDDGHTKAKPALSSDTNQGISFSQVRHGSPTIFSDGYTTRATTSQGDYSHQPPLITDATSEVETPMADPLLSPSQSPSTPVNGSIPNYHSDHTLYSPVPSIQYPLAATTMTPTALSDISDSSSPFESTKNAHHLETNQQHDLNFGGGDRNIRKSKSTRSMSIKSHSKKQKSVLGIF